MKRREGGVLSFSRLSVRSPLRTQQHVTIIILSLLLFLLLPKASLVDNFHATFPQVSKSPHSRGLIAEAPPGEEGRNK